MLNQKNAENLLINRSQPTKKISVDQVTAAANPKTNLPNKITTAETRSINNTTYCKSVNG
jgi:hypothetical protein